jgi:predicted ABC-type ATPase
LPHQPATINIAAVMSKSARSSPRCIVIAGPNGAGKTTFAREFLSKEANIIHFVNPDLIASGLSPLRPELASLAAGRLFLRELQRLVKSRVDFAFESTLSGLTYIRLLKEWKATGWRRTVYLQTITATRLPTYRRACETRDHNVPRGHAAPLLSQLDQFSKQYRLLADEWTVYDNSGDKPQPSTKDHEAGT